MNFNQYIQSYFGALSEKEITQIFSLFESKSIKKGDFLLMEGKKCNDLAFVEAGLMRMYFLKDGKEVTQWISTTGYFATDLTSFINGSPSQIFIQALVDSEILTLSKLNYDRIGDYVKTWDNLEKRFLLRCFIVLEERIKMHLSMSAEERYHAFYDQHKELFQQVPQQFLASMLGMTPETFSRIRAKG